MRQKSVTWASWRMRTASSWNKEHAFAGTLDKPEHAQGRTTVCGIRAPKDFDAVFDWNAGARRCYTCQRRVDNPE